METNLEKWRQGGLVVAAIVLGSVFMVSGVTKLIGMPMHAEMFTAFGLPAVSMYLVGAVEVISAVLILAPPTRFFGGLAICATMVCAGIVHLSSGVMAPMIFVNGVILAIAAWVSSQSGMQLRAVDEPRRRPTLSH